MMGYYGSQPPYPYVRRREPSIFDGLTLSPLPYPVLFILLLILLFLGLKFYSSYEEASEDAESQINWLLLALPLLIIFAVRWLSSFQAPFFDRQMWTYGGRLGRGMVPGPSQGGAPPPWGVAAVIVLLLVLVQYQSIFLDSWFI